MGPWGTLQLYSAWGMIKPNRVSEPAGPATRLAYPPAPITLSSPPANLWLGHLGTCSGGWARLWGWGFRGDQGCSWARGTGEGVAVTALFGLPLAEACEHGRGTRWKELEGLRWAQGRRWRPRTGRVEKR